jgi:crotonobetainyl-CoA:carnitine CoA-transferase CaiB-like acyl-CoA transferase
VFSPLEGVRVLDSTTSLSGPYCTLILGALGADVIKIEHPERGDDTRAWGPPFWNDESATYLAANASKRSLAVDLKAAEGREVVLRLASTSDVFVQNLRPGLAERLGLGFEDVRARSPRVVYCSIGAFGKEGPLRHQPGYDPLMQAAGGIMSVTGEPGRPPARAGISVVDQGTGMWAAIAILAALRARDAGAGAQLVDTSLYETAVNWLPYQIAGHLGSGGVPGPLGSALGIIAPYQAFEARDGWIMVAAGNDRLFAALCERLGLPDLVEDSRFRTNPDRVAHREELAALLAERFRTDDVGSWLAALDAAGVPAAPVQNLAEVVAHEQTRALGLLQPLPHRAIPGQRLVGLPLSVGGERVRHRSPAPALGEHSRVLLAEAGYAEEEIEGLRAARVLGGDA